MQEVGWKNSAYYLRKVKTQTLIRRNAANQLSAPGFGWFYNGFISQVCRCVLLSLA
jgi:hypothetical protein